MADDEREPDWMPSSRARWPYLTWADYEPEPGATALVYGREVPLVPLVGGGRFAGRPNVTGTWDEAGRRLTHAEWLLMNRAVLPGDQEVRLFNEPAMGMGWLGWLVFGLLAGGALVAVALSGGA